MRLPAAALNRVKREFAETGIKGHYYSIGNLFAAPEPGRNAMPIQEGVLRSLSVLVVLHAIFRLAVGFLFTMMLLFGEPAGMPQE